METKQHQQTGRNTNKPAETPTNPAETPTHRPERQETGRNANKSAEMETRRAQTEMKNFYRFSYRSGQRRPPKKRNTRFYWDQNIFFVAPNGKGNAWKDLLTFLKWKFKNINGNVLKLLLFLIEMEMVIPSPFPFFCGKKLRASFPGFRVESIEPRTRFSGCTEKKSAWFCSAVSRWVLDKIFHSRALDFSHKGNQHFPQGYS